MKKRIVIAAALLAMAFASAAHAQFGVYWGGGWGPSWWSPGGWSPGWGPQWGWGGLGPGWWGPSPYYSYYNGVQDGVGAGLLLGELDRINGVKETVSDSNYSAVLALINSEAQTLAGRESSQTAALAAQGGAASAIANRRAYWNGLGRQTDVVSRGAETRLGVSGFAQGLKILYIVEPASGNVTVIVGSSQFQLRQSASASFTAEQN